MAETTLGQPWLSPATQDFIAGGVAGAASTVAGYPVDTVRIRLQQPHSPYTSLGHGLQQIVQKEGVFALFKGMGPPVSTVAVQNAVTFYSYGASERLLRALQPTQSHDAPSSLATVFTAGCMAGAAQGVVITPVDLLKIRLQVASKSPGAFSGPLQLAKHILRAEGLRGMFRGLPVTMVRDFPSHGVYFGLYEFMQNWQCPDRYTGGKESSTATFISGGIAGVVSWFSVYPIDVIKSRIQASSGSYGGWIAVGAKTVGEEGWGVMVKGMNATLMRAFLVNGVIFSVYDACLPLLSSLR